MKNNFVVIMAGGVGSRFWPMSTAQKPKQFIDVLGTGKTLLQQTVERFKNICPTDNILIVTSANYKALVLEQCPQLLESNVLLEPCMRNTAPCIAYASYKIKGINPNANIVVAPSDHLITDGAEFERVIKKGLDFTQTSDVLLTLGIKPHRPDTGYGYIQAKGEGTSDVAGIVKVNAFKEKPNLEKAKEYLAESNYSWNSGIFIWSLKSIIKSLEENLPDVAAIFKAGESFYNSSDEQSFIDKQFPTCEKVSVDYGIMEKANNIYVQPVDFGWSDLGTWGSLWEEQDRTTEGNAIIGDDVHLIETNNCIVNMPADKKVVIQGLDDFIVVDKNNTLLICKKEQEQRIKEFQAL